MFIFVWGPIVLARDERLEGPALEAILTPVVSENKYINLPLKDHSDTGIWMVFAAKFIPESYAEYGAEPFVEAELCDYASAGNAMTVYPFFKVWMASCMIQGNSDITSPTLIIFIYESE